jgi:CRP-like cAMP-binding protein
LPPRHFTENRRWRAMMLRASRFFNALSQSISGAELAERVAILAVGEVFSVVPDNELKILAMMFEPIWFDDGQVICRPGDSATQVYAVAEGEIEVQLYDGRSIRVLRRGGVVGEYGMFGSGARTATLIARGRCRALALDYQRFHRFLLAFPESALALMRLTVEQLLSRNEMLQALQQ